jgi:2-polyprenyl-3-methyl-5-hydroxy-6-metoxy-1,4-benzoquinol methylase
MSTKPYERLSQVYDLDWGGFALQYVPLIHELLGGRAIAQARILDLACGTGQLAVELANAGHSVHGIDVSPQMIEIANAKSAGLSNVRFEVQNMAAFRVKGMFDLVTCTFDSINYLLVIDDVKAMLRRVAAAVRDSGVFVFDSNTHQLYAARHSGTYERELGGQAFAQKLSYEPLRREATVVFEFADGTTEIHRQRPYDLDELTAPLAEAGLRIIHAFSWFDKRPYTADSERLICVAEREIRRSNR